MSYFARSKHGFAVFALGAVLAACASSPEVQAAAVDASIYRLLPADSVAVFGVDLGAAKASPFYERLTAGVPVDGLEDWIAETGFDPRQDLDGVVGAFYLAGDDTEGVIVARGRFDTILRSPRLDETMESSGSHRGVTIYQRRMSDGEVRGDSNSLAFLTDNLAVFGERDRVVNAVERHAAGGPSLADNAELSGRATDAQSSGQFWMVASDSGKMLQSVPSGGDQRQARILEIFATMSRMSLTADVVHGFELSFSGSCDTPENARTLAEAARGMLALARISLPVEEQDMLQLLDRVIVQDMGQTFEAQVALDSLQVEDLLDHMDSRQTAGN